MAQEAIAVVEMPISRAVDGTTIEFAFRDTWGGDHLFACNPAVVADIVARFALAVRQAAEQRLAKSPTGQRIALPSRVTGGGVSPTLDGTVILTLALARGGYLEFELPPTTAQHLSVLLAGAIAKIPPQGRPQ
jgi:hypothetical protein